MKYLLLFIFLLNLIIFVNCKLECEDSGIANYQLIDGYCNNSEFIGPSLFIYNFLKFDKISIKPDPIFKNIQVDTSYQFGLDYGVTYEISCFNSACNPNINQFSVTTKNGPRFISTQPSCNGSCGYIDFIDSGDTSGSMGSEIYTFSIDGGNVTLPYQVTPNTMINNAPISISAKSSMGSSCTSSFYFSPSYQNSNPIPIIEVIHPTCEFNGEIHIPNYSDYSTITVTDEATNIVSPTSNGVYTGLGNELYTITTESTLCGKQIFTRSLENVAPYFKIVVLDNSCPTNPLIKLDVNTTQNYEIYLDDDSTVVSEPFYFNTSNYRITLSIECGQYSIDMNLPISYPPIQYTVEQLDYCVENYTLTLLYNSTLVQDLIVSRAPKVNEKGNQPVTINPNDNSVNASMDETYFLSSKCYTEEISIGKQYPKPAIQLSKESNYCTDFIDVYVYNWLDFENPLTLQVTPNSESSGINFPTYQSVDGLFKNVSNQFLTLTYNYRGCSSKPLQMQFGNAMSLNDAGITLDIAVNRYPTCYYLTGNANVTLKKTSGEFISVSSKDFQLYSRGSTVNFYDSFIGDCGYDKTGNQLPHYVLEEATVTIETILKPVCQYSTSGGTIQINSNTGIDVLYINGSQVVLTGNNQYNVGYGNVTIEIDFDRFTECDNHKFVYFVEAADPFEVQYTTVPITDCSIGTGSINIPDFSTYTTLQLDGISVEGTYINPVTSGFHNLQFENQLTAGMCSGETKLYVPTSIDVDIGYSVIRKPLCEKDAGGYIHFDSIIDKSTNKQLSISSVGTVDSNFNGAKSISGLYSGYQILTVSNGTCNWQVPITLDLDTVVITHELISSGISGSCRTMGSIKYSTDNEFAASSLTIVQNRYSGYKNIGLQLFGEFSTLVSITLTYGVNNLCSINYDVNNEFSDYNGGVIEYVVLKPPLCNSIDQLMDIQILNYQQYTKLTISGIAMGENGIFRNIMVGQRLYGNSIYQGCSQISTWQPFEMVEVVIPGKTITDETCWGSKDGILDYSSDETNYYYMSRDENSILLPLVSKNHSSIFSDATSGSIQTYKINKNNPTCIQYEQLNFIGHEPVIQTSNLLDQCTVDGLGSVDIKPSIDNLAYQYNLTGTNFQQEFTGVANVSGGNYSVYPFEITSDNCKRIFNDKFYVSVGSLLNNIELNIKQGSDCIKPVTVITPALTDIMYQYTLTTPSNKTTTYQQIGSFTLNSTEIGNYSLSVSSGVGNCIQLHTFENKCMASGTSNKNSSLGLKVGLSIGLVALVGIVTGTLLFLRKRKRDATKASSIYGVQHEMNTVSTFQGGHIVSLDKF